MRLWLLRYYDWFVPDHNGSLAVYDAQLESLLRAMQHHLDDRAVFGHLRRGPSDPLAPRGAGPRPPGSLERLALTRALRLSWLHPRARGMLTPRVLPGPPDGPAQPSETRKPAPSITVRARLHAVRPRGFEPLASASGGLLPGSTCTETRGSTPIRGCLRRPVEGLRRVGVLPGMLLEGAGAGQMIGIGRRGAGAHQGPRPPRRRHSAVLPPAAGPRVACSSFRMPYAAPY